MIRMRCSVSSPSRDPEGLFGFESSEIGETRDGTQVPLQGQAPSKPYPNLGLVLCDDRSPLSETIHDLFAKQKALVSETIGPNLSYEVPRERGRKSYPNLGQL